jgi:hypothetical protein
MVERHCLRGMILVAVTAVLGVPTLASATPREKIGPHQVFMATVNDSRGTPNPVVIKVACPGPGSGGRTGHPLAGQTLEVLPAPYASPDNGTTGDSATSIVVFFGAPPPGAPLAGRPTFDHYGAVKQIPTSLTVPCSGTGVVTFVPLPQRPPTSRSVGVPIEYANVADTGDAR